jgi:hypothetical protein
MLIYVGHHLQYCPTNMDPTYDRPPPQDYQCELCKIPGVHWKSLCPFNTEPMSITQKRRTAGIIIPTKNSSQRQARFKPELTLASIPRKLSSSETNAVEMCSVREIVRKPNLYQSSTEKSHMILIGDKKQDGVCISTKRAGCQHCDSHSHRSESCPEPNKNIFSKQRSPRKDAEYGRLSRFSDSYGEDATSPILGNTGSSKKTSISTQLHRSEDKKGRVFNGEDVTMDLDSLVTELSVQCLNNNRKRARSLSPKPTIRSDLNIPPVDILFGHVHKKIRSEVEEAKHLSCKSFFCTLE